MHCFCILVSIHLDCFLFFFHWKPVRGCISFMLWKGHLGHMYFLLKSSGLLEAQKPSFVVASAVSSQCPVGPNTSICWLMNGWIIECCVSLTLSSTVVYSCACLQPRRWALPDFPGLKGGQMSCGLNDGWISGRVRGKRFLDSGSQALLRAAVLCLP